MSDDSQEKPGDELSAELSAQSISLDDVMAEGLDGELMPLEYQEVPGLVDRLEMQHPIDGMFARVVQRIGGEGWIEQEARKNPMAFMRMFVTMRPSLQQTGQTGGDIHFHVHNTLGKSDLDG